MKRDEYLQAIEFEMNSEVRKNIENMNESNVRVVSPHLKEAIDNPTMSLLRDIRMDILFKEKAIDQHRLQEYEAI